MKLKIIFILAVFLIAFTFFRFAATEETTSRLTLGEKIDAMLKMQEEVIKKLDLIQDELTKIKVRLSRLP